MAGKQTINVKILVNKQTNHIIFAEAGKDFVDLLFSFLTLPLGTIIRLSRKQSSSSLEGIGCMDSIYESVENLDASHFGAEACKTLLLYPRNAAEAQCKELKLELEDSNPTMKDGSGEEGVGFVKGEPARYMITDDLRVMPVSLSTCFSLLRKLGIKELDAVEDRLVEIEREEVVHLLNRSLLSKKPLTEAILLKQSRSGTIEVQPKSDIIETQKTKMPNADFNNINMKNINMKLMLRNSDNKVLFAEASEELANLLFSFLTLPLGSILKLLDGGSSAGCIDNLYRSVEELGTNNYIKSNECMAILNCPGLEPLHNEDQFNRNIGESFNLRQYYKNQYPTPSGQRLTPPPSFGMPIPNHKRGPATYLITDNLVVTPLSPISDMSPLKTSAVPVNDVTERVISIGIDEGLRLLKASLISKTALSAALI